MVDLHDIAAYAYVYTLIRYGRRHNLCVMLCVSLSRWLALTPRSLACLSIKVTQQPTGLSSTVF